MKRNVLYPGCTNLQLIAALTAAWKKGPDGVEEHTAQVGQIQYSGPVRNENGAANWYITATKVATEAPKSARAKTATKKAASKKKAAPKKSASAKQAKRSAGKRKRSQVERANRRKAKRKAKR